MKDKIIEEVLKRILKNKKRNREIQLKSTDPTDFQINMFKETIKLTIKKKDKEFLELVEDIDILQLATNLINKKTKEKVEIPKELQGMLFQYGDYIKDWLRKEIKSKLGGEE